MVDLYMLEALDHCYFRYYLGLSYTTIIIVNCVVTTFVDLR